MNSFVKTSLGFLSMAFMAGCQTKDSGSTINLNAQEFSSQLKQKKGSVILIDVRTPGEFQSGHIPGAISIDYNGSGFSDGVAKLPKDKELFIYCRSGGRSKASVSTFLSAGFKSVTNLSQGILGWQSAGLSITRD